MKKTKLRKKSKAKISTIQNKIWKLCKQIIRKRYPNVCYTCNQTGLVGSNMQTGHVPFPKAVLGAYLKYDLRVLRPQCFNCNIQRGGMGAEAYKRMLAEIGQQKMKELEQDRQKTVKAYDWYVKVLQEYTLLASKLTQDE